MAKRPFGFNEFDGAGGGYAVKFSSLFDIDENVVVGSVPASAGKTSITQYGMYWFTFAFMSA